MNRSKSNAYKEILMNQNERKIWAAAYAADWNSQQDQYRNYGVEPSVVTSVENAWAAVDAVRTSVADVDAAFGADSEVAEMLREMLSE